MKRRTLIGGLAGGLFAGLGTRATHARQPLLEAGAFPMRTFGKTGVKLTVIGLASGRFPLISTEEAIALTRRAVELGINYFDTAHGYWNGHSEEVYGKVLPAVRQRVFLTTKAADRTRRGAESTSRGTACVAAEKAGDRTRHQREELHACVNFRAS